MPVRRLRAGYTGSSPRTRGTLFAGRFFAVHLRFIPAHAGNTSTRISPSAEHTVHPRASGEHTPGASVARASTGSSPRTRGTLGDAEGWRVHRPVHPRARGEHSCSMMVGCAADGSSPRTRGTHPSGCSRASGLRFIPAHAGNTLRSHWAAYGSTVHPRARGEHATSRRKSPFDFGSSPRTRGTRPGRLGQRLVVRFIPAHAGNTPSPATRPPLATVHPRARGEHSCSTGRYSVTGGSSPRTRGTLAQLLAPDSLGRFIPAHAGNTASFCI